MHGTHYKHNPLVSSSVFNSNLSLLIYEFMCVGTLGYIPRYMGRMSNNNKMLINNSSRCFANQVVYIRIMVTWDIKYIDEGFLVWIIPSTYLSHKAANWAYTIGFACIRFYSVLSVLWYFLSLGDNSGYMKSGYSNMWDIRYIHKGFLVWIIPSMY